MTPDARLAVPSPAIVAEALAGCPQLWAPHVEHAAGHRTHERLAVAPGWEAYLITWPSGHGVELHDHGGSTGAVAVVEGDLVELVARPSGPAGPAAPVRSGPITRVPLATGTVRRVPGTRVHDVVNAGPVPATSIHVYAPALSTMTFYDDDLRPVRTERVYPEPPLLGIDVVAEVLAVR